MGSLVFLIIKDGVQLNLARRGRLEKETGGGETKHEHRMTVKVDVSLV